MSYVNNGFVVGQDDDDKHQRHVFTISGEGDGGSNGQQPSKVCQNTLYLYQIKVDCTPVGKEKRSFQL